MVVDVALVTQLKPWQKRKREKGESLRAIKKLASELTINSIWRVKTADKETTASGKVILEQWSLWQITDRLGASATHPEGSVKVKYLEDAADEEAITYDIGHFILNAKPAPRHLVDLSLDAPQQVSVSYEQSVYEKQERAELLPL